MPNPYVNAGKAITVMPPAAGCSRGIPLRVGDLVGLPVNDREAGSSEPVEIWTFGANRIPKAGGAGVAFDPGQLVYFESATGLAVEVVAGSPPFLRSAASTRFLIGVCTDTNNADEHQSVGLLVLPFAQAILEGSGGQLASDGLQGPILNDEAIERVFYTLVIPGGTVAIGDFLSVQFMLEFIARNMGGQLRVRVREDDELGAIVFDGGFGFPVVQPAPYGLDFFHASVIDTGSGLADARVVDNFNEVDHVFDFRTDVTLAFTGEWNAANVGNIYRGMGAHISRA